MTLGSCGPLKPADSLRFDDLFYVGCIACRLRGVGYVVPERDHLNLGGFAGMKRRGHQATIPLCCWHHRGIPHEGWSEERCERELGPSKQLSKVAFFLEFGRPDELLEYTNKLLEAYCAETRAYSFT